MNNLVGTTIEHYQVLVKIRETPTRVLYKVYNTRAQNCSALEVLKTAGPEPVELLRLINEQMRRNAELMHPNIAAVIDTGLHEGLVYIVYNFCPLYSLRRFFNRTYSWQETSRELVSITHAMAYAHENGIVHGFLHPSTILLDEKRNPVLFDFGFEQLITNYILAYSPGAWINRWGFEYRPPEQLNGAMPDARCDIYAMGMMLHEWLNGNVPLLEPTILGTLQLRGDVAFVVDSKSNTPAVIQSLVRKCISQDPADRYQSMQEVYIVLARGALDMSITNEMVRRPLEIPKQRFNPKPILRRARVPALVFSIAVFAVFLLNMAGISPLKLLAPPASVTSTATGMPPTPTRTARPTFTAGPAQVFTATPTMIALNFPVFQSTPITSAIDRTISGENINQMIMLSILGIGDLNRLVASPDGEHVAAASSIGIFVFDAQSLKLEKHIDTRSWITALDFSPDSRVLASGDRDGLIQLWSTETWEEAEAPFSGHTKAILDLSFSPDGSKLASVSLDTTLMQWSVNAVERQPPLRTAVIGGLTAAVYSIDSTRIVTGGNDFQITIWDANTLTSAGGRSFSARIRDIASIPGTDLFVIGGSNQQVVLFDPSAEAGTKLVGNMQYSLASVSVSPDGMLIAAGDINGGVAVWERSGDEVHEVFKPRTFLDGDPQDLESPGSPHSLAFSSDGRLIFSGLHIGAIRALDAKTGESRAQNLDLNAHIKNLAISHNSQILMTQQEDNTLTVWDLWSGLPRYQRRGEIKPGDPFSPDDSMFTVASVDPGLSTVTIYDPANGDEIYKLKSQTRLRTLQFVSEGAQLLMVYEKANDLWSMSSGQQLETRTAYDGTGCLAIKDIYGQDVASVTNFQHVIIANPNKPGLCNFDPLDWKTDINEAQSIVAFGGSSKLTMFRTQRADREDQNLRGVNRRNIVSVAISPDGTLIAAAYDDFTIHIWDVETRDELTSPSGLFGHNDAVTDLRFTPDGKLLLSASLDGTIRLWGVPY